MNRSPWKLATRRDVVHRATRTSLIVGTLLVVINQGDRLLVGDMDWSLLLRVLLTYFVPYAVATYASVGALRD